MSRSRRHTPIKGNCGGSEKYDKQCAHRRVRQHNRMRILAEKEPLDDIEMSNIAWTGMKDGKHYFDQTARPECMRK